MVLLHHSLIIIFSNLSSPTSLTLPKLAFSNIINDFSSVSSVAQLCPTLCDPMDCSTPGFPVHHQLPELAQTQTQTPSSWWCHPTISSSVAPFFSCLQSPSTRVFSSESVLRIRWPKYWSFSFSVSPSNEHPGLISFRSNWVDLLAVQGPLKCLRQHDIQKHQFFGPQLSLWSNLH